LPPDQRPLGFPGAGPAEHAQISGENAVSEGKV
jgi:hypothetical protein